MKRLLTIQDISCVGKCSLTVALPVISAMSVEAAVLPTAVLSTHTAFPKPIFRDLTGDMMGIADHWQQNAVTFDGICSGYLGSPEQVEAVLAIHKQFPGMLIVDPVMGDNGRLYDRIDGTFAEKMRTLCAQADVIMPNVTEACYLAGVPYADDSERFAGTLLEKLSNLCAGTVIITGVDFGGDCIGVVGSDQKENFAYAQARLSQSYHGTGDIFCATCAGALLLGKDWKAAAVLAADFTAQCIRATMDENRDKRFGVCFEKAIPWLLEMIKK